MYFERPQLFIQGHFESYKYNRLHMLTIVLEMYSKPKRIKLFIFGLNVLLYFIKNSDAAIFMIIKHFVDYAM